MHGRDPASVYRQRWRWNAVQTAHQGYPLIGISTSSTILSPARYRPGSIKSPIPWRASRWLRLQGRPRAHQSEPAPSRVDIGFLACIVIVHPSNQRATTAATSTTEGARTENVSAAKAPRKERTPEEGTRWKRIYGKILKLGIATRGNIPKVLSTLSISQERSAVTSGRAEGHLFERNFCSWSSWFVCDVNFFIIFPFSFFFLDRDLWRLLTFFRWNIFKKYLSLDFLIDNR